MKNDLKLFWQNMVNNKYWVPLLVFAFMGIMLGREKYKGSFDEIGLWFWLMEVFFVLVSLIIIIMTWVQRDSQKD